MEGHFSEFFDKELFHKKRRMKNVINVCVCVGGGGSRCLCNSYEVLSLGINVYGCLLVVILLF